MMKEIKRPFNAQKALRVACLVLADLILINLSAFLALYIRFEFDFRQLYATTFLRDMLIYAGINSACTILIFHILKLYNSLWEFASVSELVRITLGCFFSAVFYMVGMFMLHLTVPRSFPAIYMLILCLLCGALRLSYRCVRRTRAGLRSEGEKRTMIFYEAPHKLLRTLNDLRDTFGGEREITLARELTKLHEQTLRTTLDGAVAHFTENAPKGEFVLVLRGAPERSEPEVTAEQALEIVARYRSEGRALKEACKLAAADTGFGKNELYKMALNA